jgi:hypothetical protein
MQQEHATIRSPAVTLFADCNWPPPGYADRDGYSEIRVTNSDGVLGDSEAQGDGRADRITSNCSVLQLAYTFASQGAESHLTPFTARIGDIMTPNGAAWIGDRSRLSFYPARNEIVVLRNNKNVLDHASCSS